MSERRQIGKYEFVKLGKKILIFVGDALHEDSTEYLTQEQCDADWKVLKANRVVNDS